MNQKSETKVKIIAIQSKSDLLHLCASSEHAINAIAEKKFLHSDHESECP